MLAGKCDICLFLFTGFGPKGQEPEAVVSAVEDQFSKSLSLADRHIYIFTLECDGGGSTLSRCSQVINITCFNLTLRLEQEFHLPLDIIPV